MVTARASTCCGLPEKSFSLVLTGLGTCIRRGTKSNRPARRIQRLEGIVPGSRHLWRCQPWPPDASSRTRRHRFTDDRTYIGKVTARNRGCLYSRAQVYIDVCRAAHGLLSIAQLRGHCPVRNKGLRSFFRTSHGICGPTIPSRGTRTAALPAGTSSLITVRYQSVVTGRMASRSWW
jgi:hypothetical protein